MEENTNKTKFYPVTYEVFTGSRFKKCSVKKRFASRKEAKTFMYHHNVQKYITKKLTVYKCRFCGFYHIGGIENMIAFNKDRSNEDINEDINENINESTKA